MTHGVLPEDIGDQWQVLISKVQRKAALELMQVQEDKSLQK